MNTLIHLRLHWKMIRFELIAHHDIQLNSFWWVMNFIWKCDVCCSISIIKRKINFNLRFFFLLERGCCKPLVGKCRYFEMLLLTTTCDHWKKKKYEAIETYIYINRHVMKNVVFVHTDMVRYSHSQYSIYFYVSFWVGKLLKNLEGTREKKMT